MKYRTIYELFHDVAARKADSVAYRYKRDGRWHDLTWSDQRETVERVAKSLIALGVKPDEKVCLLSQTRLEWVQVDLGIASCGGVTVGIYPSNLAEGCSYIVNHSDGGVIFVENDEQLAKIDAERPRMPGLRQVVVFDGPGRSGDHGVLSWAEFLELGSSVSDETARQRAEAIQPDDVASIVYTSGTTGQPKGALLTHRNMLFTSWSIGEKLHVDPEFVSLLFLPLAHVFARMIAFCSLARGSTTAFAENMSTIPANLKEIRPQFIASVPRVYEKVYQKITGAAEESGGLKKKLFDWAVEVGYRESRLRRANRPLPPLLRLQHSLATRLVLRRVQAVFGGQLIWGISGAAPLNKSIGEFFNACGVTILEGIGMTENSSFSNLNEIGDNRIGTVGQAGPGIEMKLAEDGEVLYRGDNVMKGYYKDPEATAEAIDAEGWLHTGDIGTIDEDGFLTITDRKKDLIITAGGKNIAPQKIERIIRTSPYVSHTMAYGDRKKFISALITLDAEHIAAWARKHGLPSDDMELLATHPKVLELIESEVDRLNEQLASFESVKKFQILPQDFSIETGELTPTLKIRRKLVVHRNLDLLEAMYAD